jgi:hypothetical protein
MLPASENRFLVESLQETSWRGFMYAKSGNTKLGKSEVCKCTQRDRVRRRWRGVFSANEVEEEKEKPPTILVRWCINGVEQEGVRRRWDDA